jgi:nicotinate-nucleotide adenylyltransferase
MHIGLFFGSFNPIHNGHLIIANHISENYNLNEVWFVVSPQNPDKKNGSLLNENHRFRLIQLALEGCKKLRVTNIEFSLPRPSYTINTIMYLKEKYPSHQFSIILGSDGFNNIEGWKNAEYLKSNCRFMVYKRTDENIKKKDGWDFEIIEGPLLQISSTYIRKQIIEKKSIQFLVPEIVKEEIYANNYYGEQLKKKT